MTLIQGRRTARRAYSDGMAAWAGDESTLHLRLESADEIHRALRQLRPGACSSAPRLPGRAALPHLW